MFVEDRQRGLLLVNANEFLRSLEHVLRLDAKDERCQYTYPPAT